MNTIFQSAKKLQEYFLERGWKFCFAGGLAVQRWGEPRLTLDVDATLLTGFGKEKEFAQALLAKYPARRPDALEFSLRTRVLLLQDDQRVGLDIAFGALPFESRVIQRASYYEFSPGVRLLTCSAEDLVVFKAFADRDRDWADIEGILSRQGNKLDLDLIFAELKPLAELKESPGIIAKLSRKITQSRTIRSDNP